MSSLHICRPRILIRLRVVQSCPTCGQKRRMVSWYAAYYGWDTICCTCGDHWQDDELCPRPFCPGWRKRSSEKATKMWREWGRNPSKDEQYAIMEKSFG